MTDKDLTPLICDCCGGHIDKITLKCNSCGTQYRIKSNGMLEFVTYPRKVKFMTDAVIIPRFIVESDMEKAMEYSLHQLAERLVEHIMPLCEWVQEYDPRTQSYYLHMRIGLAEPKSQNTTSVWRDD